MDRVKTQDFSRASTLSIDNPQLQRALRRVGAGFDAERLAAVQEVTPQAWEEWREQAQRIKAHTLAHLDYYLELLHDNVVKSGGQVHFARDAAQANDIVAGLARTRQVRVAVKSKSMVSEELDLNPALESSGVRVYETDLGEYIIQMAGETPSHIIAPALHKTKEDVAGLFTENLGLPPTDDIPTLARAARETLRDRFFEADMGISGANFLIAETGSLAIVSNEGNGRFCTSAPRIHVGIAGMEKVIPSLQDMAVFLRLLPRSATGQRITSYVSLISGPRREGDEDGPEEFHLVLVDNGRSRLLADEELREALHCIRCGACLNVCPVYRKVGGHAYGWVYPGPIGAVVTPVLTGLKQARDLPYASTLCGACRDACPVKINIPRMLLELRSKLAEGPDKEQKAAGKLESFLARGYARLMSGPRLLALVHRVGRTLQKPLQWAPFIPFSKSKGMFKRMPVPLLSRWTRSRDFPALPPRTFHEIWRRDHAPKRRDGN